MKEISYYRRAVENMAGTFYENLPGSVVDCAGRLHPLLATLTGLRKCVTEIAGRTRLGNLPAKLLVAGSGPGVDYFIHRFFGAETRRRPIGQVQLLKLPRLLERLRGNAQMTVAFVDRLSSRLLFNRDYLALPDWIGSRMAVPSDPYRYSRRSKSLKNDMRKVVSAGLTCDVTRNMSVFDSFFHKMYVPFTRNRFGETGVLTNIHQLRRVFRSGGLIVAKQKEKSLAAALFMKQERLLKLVVLGTDRGDPALVSLGVFSAIYAFCLQYAKELGCHTIDFGASRPNLNDGALRYKRKWGVTLVGKPDVYHDLLLYWNELGDSVINFLYENPIVFQNEKGLWSIMSTFNRAGESDTDPGAICRNTWMPGLRGLYAIGLSAGQCAFPPGVFWLDPAAGGDDSPRGLQRRAR